MDLSGPVGNSLRNYLLVLFSFGFTQCQAYYSLFTKLTDDAYVVLLYYVHDMLITHRNQYMVHPLQQQNHQVFHIKNLGRLRYF